MLRRSLLLAWLVAILGILVPSIASAATTANLETRVKAFELVAPTLIGRSTARTTEKHPEKSNAYDEIASGSPLAAEAGGGGTGGARGGGDGGGGGPAATFIAGPGGSVIQAGLSPAELLMPGGVRLGQSGASSGVRVIQGGSVEAGMMFEQLSAGGTPLAGGYPGRAVTLPGGGFVGMRTFATGTGARALPAATLDVNIPGIGIRELKFLP